MYGDHGDDWGENGCNDFSQNMTAYTSAKNCSTSGASENDPSFCFTQFESFDQEDFYGVRENRGCDSGSGNSQGISSSDFYKENK